MRLSPEAARALAQDARVGRLATVDPDGRPNTIPVCFALDGDTLYSGIDEKPKETRRLQRIRNLQRDPRATVLIDHYEEDWTKVWWVRLRGRGRLVEDADEFARAEMLLTGKYDQYRDAPPNGSYLAVDVDEWRGWSYSPIG